eukprot:gnl/MRDRNA2_/MRDRNA2_64377_c0_seq1.p1 gnl/MRDRNA2_/MRDRNA2_64377_c0~~gnl/MRDRNA2_/MRDRNA2_64377_c0_seq1.p1  ORF type:complete len:234 (+),score=64.78 gnl/MRDRNA2_/MRDRNA2_64377_c0_seq1:91-702(+)
MSPLQLREPRFDADVTPAAERAQREVQDMERAEHEDHSESEGQVVLGNAKGKGKGKGKAPPLPDSTALAKGKGKSSPYKSGQHATPPCAPSASKKVEAAPVITVNVMFMDGRTESVEVPASDTVRMLKEKLTNMLEYSAYRQALIFNGKIMRDHEVLRYSGVEDGSLLNICIKTPNPCQVDDDVASVRANVFDELTRRVAVRT